jgi:MFS superfamily sulfate permease-like transporter
VNGTAAVVGVGSLIGILLLQRLMLKIPAVLVAVVLASLAVNLLDVEAHGVDTIGVPFRAFPVHDPDRRMV